MGSSFGRVFFLTDPVLVGDQLPAATGNMNPFEQPQNSDAQYGDFFGQGCCPASPKVAVQSVELKLREHLERWVQPV